MSLPTNKDRATWGRHALEAFQEKVQSSELETDIIDLIADLLHLARKSKLDTEYMIENATMHFQAEVDEQMLMDAEEKRDAHV